MAKDKVSGCLICSIWIKGKKVTAGVLPGTMVTITGDGKTYGLRVETSETDPRWVGMSLHSLKSHDATKGKEMAREEAVFGRIVTFQDPEKIRISVLLPAARPDQQKAPSGPGGGELCCVYMDGWKYFMCATCFIYLGAGQPGCCTTPLCCAEMGRAGGASGGGTHTS